jgi:hypothetical protein
MPTHGCRHGLSRQGLREERPPLPNLRNDPSWVGRVKTPGGKQAWRIEVSSGACRLQWKELTSALMALNTERNEANRTQTDPKPRANEANTPLTFGQASVRSTRGTRDAPPPPRPLQRMRSALFFTSFELRMFELFEFRQINDGASWGNLAALRNLGVECMGMYPDQ